MTLLRQAGLQRLASAPFPTYDPAIMKRFIPILTLALSFSLPAAPAAVAADAVLDAPRFQPCFAKSKKKPDWSVCEELIPAMVARHRAGEMVEGFRSCVPEGTEQADVSATFDAWISKRPHFAKYTPWATLSGGLSVLYPCPK
ncbi:MAG TPA: hypothetical protein VIN57_05430 [Magnetovibrio sp.]